jgi:hypothetical protein
MMVLPESMRVACDAITAGDGELLQQRGVDAGEIVKRANVLLLLREQRDHVVH